MTTLPTLWRVVSSHLVAHPTTYEAQSLPELRSRVQKAADEKRTRKDRPPIGKLTFRYELDSCDNPNVVHAYFIGRGGTKRRFMKLVRIDPCHATG